MNWKKILRITAVAVIPGGLVAAGAWLAVKKIRSSHGKDRKSAPELAKPAGEQAGTEAENDLHHRPPSVARDGRRTFDTPEPH